MTLVLILALLIVCVVQFGYLCALSVLCKDLKESAKQSRSHAVELRSAAYMLSQKATA